MSYLNVVTSVYFISIKGLPQKKGVRPEVYKIKIKHVKSVSFVDHCLSALPVTSVHNAEKKNMWETDEKFWTIWPCLGSNPRVVSILKEGYSLPIKMRPHLTKSPLIISGYANPIKNSYL